MGPDRGSRADRAGSPKPNGTIREYHWVERAEAFDRHFDLIFEQAREVEAVNQATVLERRRVDLAEKEWLLSQALLKRVSQILSWPIQQTRTETTTSADGQVTQVTIIEPANWRLRDVATLGRFACDLQRMAVGLPTRMAVQPFASPGGESSPVDQTQTDADNGRIPPELAEFFREEAVRRALGNAGLDDAQPDW